MHTHAQMHSKYTRGMRANPRAITHASPPEGAFVLSPQGARSTAAVSEAALCVCVS